MKKDVELVIRARDEASRAGNAIADTLDRLTKAANNAGKGSLDAGSNIDTLGAALGKVQSDYKAIDAAVTSAEAAFKRQNATLDETRTQQQAVAVQTAAAKVALERLKAETVAEGDAQVAHAAKVKSVETAYNALVRQNNVLTTSVERQKLALDEAGNAMQRLGSQATAAEIGVVEAALQRSVGVTKELSAATLAQTERYREQAREAKSAAIAEDAQRGINAGYGIGVGMPKSARDSAEALEKQLALVERIKAQINPLAVAQSRYNAEVAEANALYSQGYLKADELALHLRHLETQAKLTGNALRSPGGRGEQGKAGLFGLKPYEVQNLAYQINDLFTQVASGTSITQAFAQQGGQIAQIFAGANGGSFFVGLAANAARALPVIGLVVTALVAVGGALKNIGDLSSSERSFSGLLGASADGGLYNAKDLAATAHELDVMSGSLKDARKEVTALVQAGVSEAFLQPVADGAQKMAKIYGIDVVDAAKLAGEAFTGSFKEIQKLDKATNAFRKTQMDHIKALFDEGKASEARTYAFEIWTGEMNAGAANMEGRWAKAMRTFAGVWDVLLTKLGDSSALQGILRTIDDLLAKLDAGLSKLARLKGGSALIRAEAQQVDLQTELTNRPAAQAQFQRREQARLGSMMGGTGPSFSLTPAPRAPRTEAQIRADITANDARLASLRGQTTDTRAPGSEQGAKEDADRAEKADKKATAAAAKAEREAAAAERKAQAAQDARESATDGLRNALSSLEAKAEKVAMAPLDARLKAIDDEYTRIKAQIREAGQKGVTTVDGMSIADYEKRVEAAKDLLKQQATMKYYAEAMKALEDQRAARIKSINDQVADGTLTEVAAFKQLDAINTELSPAMSSMAKNALAFALAMRTATPNPELERFIAQMQRTLGRETTAGGKGSETSVEKLSLVSAKEREINDLVAQRNDLIQHAEELGARGKLSYEEMEAAIKKAYGDTGPEIEKRVALIKELLASMQGEIDPTAYDAWLAKLDLITQGTENLHGQLLSVADANSMLMDAGLSLWDRFVKAIEDGQNVLSAFWDSLKATVADVFADISRLIVKALVMRAIMATKAGKWLSTFLGSGTFDSEGAKAAASELKTAGGILNAAAAALFAAAKALSAAMGGGGGSTTSTAASFVNSILASVHHTGGIAGSSGVTRMAPAALWANAQRLHGGGMPGLRSGEVATILETTEEVLTRSDPRHVLNGGKSAGGGGNTKIVNLFDTADFLDKALATESGERTLINHVSRNASAFKSALGVS